MYQINLIIKDDVNTFTLNINKKILSAKSNYFQNLFYKFKESTMDEITINVPNAMIVKSIILELLGMSDTEIIINKASIKCYDFLSLNYDHLLDKITDPEVLLDIIDEYSYTEDRIKLLAKKLPKNYDMSTFPDKLQKLIKYYQWTQLLVSGSTNGTIIIRESMTGKILDTFTGHGRIFCVIISNDNKYIILADDSHNILILDMTVSTTEQCLSTKKKMYQKK